MFGLVLPVLLPIERHEAAAVVTQVAYALQVTGNGQFNDLPANMDGDGFPIDGECEVRRLAYCTYLRSHWSCRDMLTPFWVMLCCTSSTHYQMYSLVRPVAVQAPTAPLS